MRLVLHTLVTLTAAAILAGVALFYADAKSNRFDRELARAEVARFQQQIHLQTALATAGEDHHGMPASIDPSWFGESRPINPLLGSQHPWVEIAGSEQANLLHPPNPTAIDEKTASFWYNPANGIVRARVPMRISDSRALDLYNDVNESSLPSLFPEP